MEQIVHKPNKDVTISRFMAAFGKNAPVVDVDFLFTLYCYSEPMAIVDFKQMYENGINEKCYTNTNATCILRLGDRASLPAYVIGYSSDWQFTILRWNDVGREKTTAFINNDKSMMELLGESIDTIDPATGKFVMSAVTFVRFSYFLRGLPVDKGILAKFQSEDSIELSLRAEKCKAIARGGNWINQEVE